MDLLTNIFEYQYLANAVIACLLSSITCGIVGTYIVARRMVFLCGGITHASFGGLGIAFYLGANPILGAFVAAVLSALGIEAMSHNTRIREDSAIGMIWSLGMAVGALFMSMRPGYTSGDMASYLFGSIISVTNGDIIALALLTLVTLVGALLWHRTVMYASFDTAFAAAAGVRTRLISSIMAVITSLAIVLSIRIMGIVLLISLLTMPVVAAGMLHKSYTKIAPSASLIACVGLMAGITASYYMEIPSGPAIIFILTLLLLTIKVISLYVNRTVKP